MGEDKKRVCIFCQHVVDKPVPTICPSCKSHLRDKSYLVAPRGPLCEPLKNARTVRQILPNVASQKQETEKVPAAKRKAAQPPPIPASARIQPTAKMPTKKQPPVCRPGVPVESDGIFEAETEIGTLGREETEEWREAENVLGGLDDDPVTPPGGETLIEVDDEETRLDLPEDDDLDAEPTKLHPVSAAATEAVSVAATRALIDDVATHLEDGASASKKEADGFHVAGTSLLDVDSEENTDPKKPAPEGFHAAKTKLLGEK